MVIIWYTLIAGGIYWYLDLTADEPKYKQFKTQQSKHKLATAWNEYRDGVISSLGTSFNVSLSMYLCSNGLNNMVYNVADMSLSQHVLSLFGIWLITEVFEWSFHYASHNTKFLWHYHKKHHLYPNPSPLTVFSDDPLDMWVKSSPMLWIPLLFPVYDVTLFAWFTFVNFIYGVYLHSGYEPSFLPSRHSKYLVSSWHHNVHHMKNVNGNFGFFTLFLDRIFGTYYGPQQHQQYQQSQNQRQQSSIGVSTGTNSGEFRVRT